jgi:hypothetical protein
MQILPRKNVFRALLNVEFVQTKALAHLVSSDFSSKAICVQLIVQTGLIQTLSQVLVTLVIKFVRLVLVPLNNNA